MSMVSCSSLQLHEQDDVLSVWAPDVHSVPASSALRQFLVAIGVAFLFGSTVYAFTPEKPALPRVRWLHLHSPIGVPCPRDHKPTDPSFSFYLDSGQTYPRDGLAAELGGEQVAVSSFMISSHRSCIHRVLTTYSSCSVHYNITRLPRKVHSAQSQMQRTTSNLSSTVSSHFGSASQSIFHRFFPICLQHRKETKA